MKVLELIDVLPHTYRLKGGLDTGANNSCTANMQTFKNPVSATTTLFLELRQAAANNR